MSVRAEDLPPFDSARGIAAVIDTQAAKWAGRAVSTRGGGFWSWGKELREELRSQMYMRALDHEHYPADVQEISSRYKQTQSQEIDGELVEVVNHSWLKMWLDDICHEVTVAEELARAEQHAPMLAASLRVAAGTWCTPERIRRARKALTSGTVDERYVVDNPTTLLEMIHTGRSAVASAEWTRKQLFSSKRGAARKAAEEVSTLLGGMTPPEVKRLLIPSGDLDADSASRPRREDMLSDADDWAD